MPSSLNRYFDSVLYVNLDRRIDRREQSEAEFSLLQISTFARFPGVDLPDNGNAGCTASHRAIWRKVADGDYGVRVLIFEDDFMLLTMDAMRSGGFDLDNPAMAVFLSAPWAPRYDAVPHMALNERFDFMISQVPEDWDVLYLGGGYQSDPIARAAPNVIRNGGMLGTVAYAISRTFARVITESLDREHPSPDSYPGAVDMVLTNFAREHRFYTLSPRLFVPRPGSMSDLCGEVGGFPYSMTDPAHECMV